MPVSASLIRKLDKVSPDLRDVLIGVIEEIERQREESVTRSEFQELKEIVGQLAEAQLKTEHRLLRVEESLEKLTEAQKITEDRLTRLEVVVVELAEAQKRTEERIDALAEAQKKTEERLDRLTERVNELAEAQKQTEQRLNELAEAQRRTEQRVNELAEAQKQTERRLNELAEAQKQTEQKLNELAEAQKKTEETLRKLIRDHQVTREELGGLSHTVGYILEDRAYASLPVLLKQDEGIEVQDIKRDFVEIGSGRYEEINIIGRGIREGKPLWILGECKTQLKKRDVDAFLKKVSKIQHLFPGDRILLAVTYQTSPQVRAYLKEKGIRLYFSYQFKL